MDTYSYQINGTNGATRSIYFGDINVLDAFDDEYGGVIVNPERLPSNPHVFASVLRSSLSHWKIKVIRFPLNLISLHYIVMSFNNVRIS